MSRRVYVDRGYGLTFIFLIYDYFLSTQAPLLEGRLTLYDAASNAYSDTVVTGTATAPFHTTIGAWDPPIVGVFFFAFGEYSSYHCYTHGIAPPTARPIQTASAADAIHVPLRILLETPALPGNIRLFCTVTLPPATLA
jgi:hypothetical protein